MTGQRNAHLTFKGNLDAGRHAWLRLTPAYSVRLVREYVAAVRPGGVVTDPFSGTGTTALAAAENGKRGQAVDINPFLIWLGEAKARRYPPAVVAEARALLADVTSKARRIVGTEGLWQPRLRNIERWWRPSELAGLKALRATLDRVRAGSARDLLDIGFCRTLIKTSDAAFDHQSMSFKGVPEHAPAFDRTAAARVVDRFAAETELIVASAAVELPGTALFVPADARRLDTGALAPCDLLLTSPPYANRMSYIRELRPYMYWLRYLDAAVDAADLDWAAIGGTWGMATSRLATWVPETATPVDAEVAAICARMVDAGGRSGPVLANYVRKYVEDMWAHFQAARRHIVDGGQATYVVGNSTFYGHLVPVEEWYRLMLLEAGFGPVTVTAIRKRNSNRDLFEFEVTAGRP